MITLSIQRMTATTPSQRETQQKVMECVFVLSFPCRHHYDMALFASYREGVVCLLMRL